MPKLKKVPSFNTEDAERNFWSSHDSTEYVDWSKAKRVTFPHLKPSTKTISLRIPEHLLYRIKTAAHKRDVPYQSYIKVVLDRQVSEEQRIRK